MKGPFSVLLRIGAPDASGGVDNDVGCVPEGDRRGGRLFGSATPAPSHIRRFVSGSYHVALVTGSTAELWYATFFCLCRFHATCGDF